MFDNAILTCLLREQALRAPSTPSREPEGACEALRRQPEDGRQVESAVLRFRPADRTQAAQIDSPVSRGRGRRRCLPKAYLAAARRLPLCPAATIPYLTRS